MLREWQYLRHLLLWQYYSAFPKDRNLGVQSHPLETCVEIFSLLWCSCLLVRSRHILLTDFVPFSSQSVGCMPPCLETQQSATALWEGLGFLSALPLWGFALSFLVLDPHQNVCFHQSYTINLKSGIDWCTASPHT